MPTFQELQPIEGNRPKFTGKHLVMLNANTAPKAIITRAKNASLRLASFSDYKEDVENFGNAFNEADGIVFENSGIAVINKKNKSQISKLIATDGGRNAFIYSEPERYVYALADKSKEYLRGYKAAVDHLYKKVLTESRKSRAKAFDFKDDDQATWGIHATKVLKSGFTGKKINLAILDTGFNLKHPDFVNRTIVSESFIKGQTVDDKNGHGSHCTGISAGDINKKTGRRYGVAKGANIYIGKVLSNAGSGTDSGILAGIEWAITNGCKVISMSLGAPVDPGESYSNIYNDLGKKALAKGTLIIAAAGNDSQRDKGIVAPVGHPANCPSIMAVAALDNKLAVAWFSNGGLNTDGGQIDIAAPGVDVYSSWKSPANYNTISGTSMATPFVAGMAALFWEANPGATASDIWLYLTQNAMRLELPATGVGAGLVQPPKAKKK